ncbi:hypothetical protein A3K86_19230 [Photobacterium jeanii]|uniref:Uncharacterized protein n=1 Tax=Photobacterium jeanii TaxID=858640 RepID=A0A178K1X4_9GAMM|nr:hypothetical protein A3K86_19230 [Photobacterium jeanii]
MMMFCLCVGVFAHADELRTTETWSTVGNVSAMSSLTNHPLAQQVHDSLTQSTPSDSEGIGFPLADCQINLAKVNNRKTSDEQDNHSHTGDMYHYHFGMISTSRYSSMLRDDPETIDPGYQLAIEIPIAPALQFMIGYQSPLSPTLDWMLSHVSSSSRLSGWKESNLTHTQYQHRLSLA